VRTWSSINILVEQVILFDFLPYFLKAFCPSLSLSLFVRLSACLPACPSICPSGRLSAGLTDTYTHTHTQAITVIAPTSDQVIDTSGDWKQSGSLTISLRPGDDHPMQAGVEYEFSFDLVNDFSDQASDIELVSVSRDNYITTSQV
jgi:hypothetical protein